MSGRRDSRDLCDAGLSYIQPGAAPTVAALFLRIEALLLGNACHRLDLVRMR